MVESARTELIKSLLDAGADVNMKDSCGYTALHWACSWCRYDTLFELIRWAEDSIDWDARTPNGQNALEIFDSRVSAGWVATWSPSEIHDFRAELVAHIKPVEKECDGRLDIPGAFPDTIW